ncbi:MAG: phosphate signaling complex protein PhoU [Tannerellaceae bacterium]|jgi:phosphate transport system protein|nr:phosphate signaling complex protein PhoU [Tannerellaceae bacterium]
MKHAEKEMQQLKEEVSRMWKLVLSQLEKAKLAFLTGDVALAQEIVSREKRVDAYEIKIDSDCENYIALFNPVAVDLRLVLSLIKISITLERIGDFCEGIARHVADEDCNGLPPELLEELRMEFLFDTLYSMLSDCFAALEEEDTSKAGAILMRDNDIDRIYRGALDILTDHVQRRPDLIRCGLRTILLIRKLERIGDHCSNIVEEIVFYVDAKVLKHPHAR